MKGVPATTLQTSSVDSFCRVGILWLPELEEVRGEIFFHKCLMWFYGLAGPFTSLSPQTCFVS